MQDNKQYIAPIGCAEPVMLAFTNLLYNERKLLIAKSSGEYAVYHNNLFK